MQKIGYEPNLGESSVDLTTQFFAESSLLRFGDYLESRRLSAEKITEISIKCYGYGYFEKYKQQIKKNLELFVRGCFAACRSIVTFKLIFNGFDLRQDEHFKNIIEMLLKAIHEKQCMLSIIEVHTNNLTNCSVQDFRRVLKLIEAAGSQYAHQEISIQLTNWKFEKNLSYRQLISIFQNLVGLRLLFKKFRLEISSWYLSSNEAFQFLLSEMGVHNNQQMLLKKLKISQENRNYVSNYLKQISKYKQYNQFSKENEEARNIRDKIGRSLNQQIIYYLVKVFHQNIKQFVQGLLSQMENVQDFTIDLRNWNVILKLSELKNQLQSKSGLKSQHSLIQRRNKSLINTQNVSDSPVLRTAYLL